MVKRQRAERRGGGEEREGKRESGRDRGEETERRDIGGDT